MNQLALFDRPLPLLDNARGQVVYYAGFLAPAEAGRWFVALRDGIDFQAQRRMMYEREVDVPRLTAQMRVDRDDRLDGAPRPAAEAVLVEALTRARSALGERFNSIGINCYRNGEDSVAPHHDKLHDLLVGAPIALISLGSARRMNIRPQAVRTGERAIGIDLAPGSLLVMDYASQHHYLHGIAKTRATVGMRISLALRVKTD